MKSRRWPGLVLAGAGLALTALSGCQTWMAGMTLPSPRYLQHPPQYFAPSPPYPLPRELAAQERIAADAALAEAGVGAGAAVPPPAPVPPRPPEMGGDVAPLPPP
jgi:hypothetical protein